MPQSLSVVYLHAIFSTKDRAPFLRNVRLRQEMHAYLAATSKQLECPALKIGGTEDHVHILFRMNRNIAQSHWVKEVKRVSSRWIKKREPAFRSFGWQSGYAVFSVSVSNLEKVKTYIENQDHHHRKISFQQEFRAILRKHGMSWDEEHVWD